MLAQVANLQNWESLTVKTLKPVCVTFLDENHIKPLQCGSKKKILDIAYCDDALKLHAD